MANNKKINVTDLDFDQIKINLKNFLSGQEQFQDYDFEGSAMAVLLDVLAYNTHYNALYNNMAINEMFLDSARKRNSVVSIAKMLGYAPRSATCSKALVTLNVAPPVGSNATALVLPTYSQFTTSIEGKTYSFYNIGSYTKSISNGVFNFQDIELIEGTPLEFRYEVTPTARFIIPNKNVDLKTLLVRVQDNPSSSVYTTFTLAENLADVNKFSKVYWIKEIDDGLYELNFGNDAIGMALDNGNVVHLNYFVSSLDVANGARSFTYNGATLLSGANVSVVTTSVAYGGDTSEDIDSIRFNAPKIYAAQNRAVTPDDYKALVYSLFSDAASVSVWGGEDNNPPVYGKVYLCIKPKTGATKLTTTQKTQLISGILAKRNVVSVIPEIVDPEYINIAIDTTVHFNPQATTKTANEIGSIVRNTINTYSNNELNKFDGIFRYSKLTRLIDESDPSITNNITTVKLRRALIPRYNVSAQYLLNLINPIFNSGAAEESFLSTGFYIAGSDELHYLDDDGVAFVRLFKYGANGVKVVVNPQIGSVDYTKGIVDIKNLNITALADIDLELSIRPESYDVVSALTQVATIAVDHMYINVIPDPTASGDIRGGYNYTFTSSRS